MCHWTWACCCRAVLVWLRAVGKEKICAFPVLISWDYAIALHQNYISFHFLEYMQKRMENYSALVTHQHILCFSRTPEFIEFEAINSDGISSSLLATATWLWSSGESENTKRWEMFCLEDKRRKC